MKTDRCDFSIVIPIHNEEKILLSSLNVLLSHLPRFNRKYQVILVENGSNDCTLSIAQKISEAHQDVKLISLGVADYGLALNMGIRHACGTYIVCDEVDICETNFYVRALEILDGGDADFVVGSKCLPGSHDIRPLIRRFITFMVNAFLKIIIGFGGTDTHGQKAFRRESLLKIVEQCITTKDLFASELVIRARRSNVKVVEIPVTVKEIRPPSVNWLFRIPSALREMTRLLLAIYLNR